MQLVAFNASAFPYRSVVPDTNKPFLDARDGRKRGHTSLRGDVYWEETTYSDRRSLLYLPAGYDPQRPSLIVLFLHGQGATLERDVIARQAVPRQIAESGQNVALVAPQLAVDAADSSAGNFWKPGHFAAYIDEAAERLMRLYGDRRAGSHFNQRAGRHRGLQRRLSLGRLCAGARRRRSSHQGRDPDGRALRRRGQVRVLGGGAPPAGVPAERLHRVRRRTRTRRSQSLLDKRRVPYTKGLPSELNAGNDRFRAVRRARHAWRFCYARVAARSPESMRWQ